MANHIVCNINPAVENITKANVLEGEFCSGKYGRAKCKNCPARKVAEPKFFDHKIKIQGKSPERLRLEKEFNAGFPQ